MTENSAEKRAAHRYQAEHPGMTYPEALREVRRLHQLRKAEAEREQENLYDPADYVLTLDEVLRAAAADDDQLIGISLSVDRLGGPFDIDLGPEIDEGPVDVEDVDIDIETLWYDEHERFEGDTTIGEAHVTAAVAYSACVYKSTYYAASETVSWRIVDPDWNDHYVRVAGEFTAELVYHFVVNPGAERPDDWSLQELIQVGAGPVPTESVAV
jgi:hypothetical protein